MKVIVTGASGFIGRNVLLRAPRTWQITALYNRSLGFDLFVQRSGLRHVTPVSCDLTDAASVAALAKRIDLGADAVLYLAANADPSRSVEHPAWDLQSNTLALVNFLEHSRTNHAVYVSSGAVYDGLIGPVSPASHAAPRLPYAISKLMSEHYVRAFCERRGAPASYVIVRFFGAYGPYEPARKVTTRWLTAIAEGRQELTIRGNGDNLIDFMYVDDAVDGLLRVVATRDTSLTVDFASGVPITINQLVDQMADVLGVRVRVRHEGHTEEFIRFRSIDTTMRERFGVSSSVTFADGLTRLSRFLHQSAAASVSRAAVERS